MNKMTKKVTACLFAAALIRGGAVAIAAAPAPADRMAAVSRVPVMAQERPAAGEDACYECHNPIKSLRAMGKHARIDCAKCHDGIDKHLANPGPETRPGTDTSWEVCGSCHKEQYESFMKTSHHRPGRDEKSQLTSRSPNPYWDKLMAGHGFTKEHDLTRSHSTMLIDHLVVDRAYGGRFQGKNG